METAIGLILVLAGAIYYFNRVMEAKRKVARTNTVDKSIKI